MEISSKIIIDVMRFIDVNSDHLTLSDKIEKTCFHFIERQRINPVLLKSVKLDDWNLVELVLDHCDVDLKDNRVFRRASRRGRLDVVDRLLSFENRGVDPSSKNNYAIKWSCANSHSEVVERLLKDDRVDPTVENNLPIALASQRGCLAIVEMLLDFRSLKYNGGEHCVNPAGSVDVEGTNVENNRAIIWASEYGHLNVVNRLLKDPRVDPAARHNYSIQHASAHGHLNVVNRLLKDPRVDPSDDNNCAIRWASEHGHLRVVERLLQDPRVNPSAQHNYAIELASASGHLGVVNRLLADPRVDPSAGDNYPIRWAARNGHLEVVNRLLEDPRVYPSADDNYAIVKASQNGHLEVVNRLLEDPRVDPSAQNNRAIKLASKHYQWDVVERLLYYSQKEAIPGKSAVDPSVSDNYVISQVIMHGPEKLTHLMLCDYRVLAKIRFVDVFFAIGIHLKYLINSFIDKITQIIR